MGTGRWRTRVKPRPIPITGSGSASGARCWAERSWPAAATSRSSGASGTWSEWPFPTGTLAGKDTRMNVDLETTVNPGPCSEWKTSCPSYSMESSPRFRVQFSPELGFSWTKVDLCRFTAFRTKPWGSSTESGPGSLSRCMLAFSSCGRETLSRFLCSDNYFTSSKSKCDMFCEIPLN